MEWSLIRAAFIKDFHVMTIYFFFAKLTNTPKERIYEVLEKVELLDAAKIPAGKLSKDMAQRGTANRDG